MTETTENTNSPWILEANARNFESDVVQRSYDIPVVMAFLAPWAAPCKTLGAALEKRAREGDGRFLYAWVDMKKSPELAKVFQIQAVPTVLALSGGRMLDGFQGELPEAELDAFLERVAPGGAVVNPVAEARALAAEGDVDGAMTCLRAFLADPPKDASADEGWIALAELLVGAGELDEAELALKKLGDEALATPEAKALLARIEFVKGAGDLEDLRAKASAQPESARARLEFGLALVALQDYEAGLEELLESLKLDPDLEDGAAKKGLLETFDVLGLEDPIANHYRFQLSLVLFA